MSEVHRYKVQCMFSEDGSKIEYFPHGPSIVMAEAFDAQRLRADTAEAERDKWETRACSEATKLHEAEQKLAAAEQRIADMKGALENLLDAYSKPDYRICCSGHDCGCMGATNHQQAEHYAKEALAALNPNPEAESHG